MIQSLRRELVDRRMLKVVLVLAVLLRTHRLDSVPPGLWYDEALNGLDVQDILQGKLSIFFERAGNPREPLFIYLQAISVYLLGSSALALRLVSAVIGSLTVLATFFLAREWFGYRVGLLSMATIAVGFWLVDLSRVGMRAIAAPLFIVLALLFLWQGIQGHRRGYFAVAGLFLGLGFYTYTAVRVLALLFAAIILVEFVADHGWLRREWRNLVVFIAITAIIVAPLGAYFVTHPAAFLARVGEVSVVGATPVAPVVSQTVPESALGILGMFFVAGDHNWRHNMPGRPVFDPLLGALFVLGLAWTMLNRHRGRGWLPAVGGVKAAGTTANVGVAPQVWLILWFIIALIPGIFSDESPHFLRLTSLAPAVFMLAALGGVAAWQWVAERWGRWTHCAFATFLVVLLAGSGVTTYRDYFYNWASQPGVYWAFNSNLVEAASFLEQIDGGRVAYPGLYFYGQLMPTVQFLAHRYYDANNWMGEESEVLALPLNIDQDACYMFAPPIPEEGVVSRYFAGISPYRRTLAPDGNVAYEFYRLPVEQLRSWTTPQQPVNVVFGDQIELVGATYHTASNTRLMPGGTIDVDLLWRVTVDTPATFNLVVHVVDEQGRSWGQEDLTGEKPPGWRVGDLVLSRHHIAVPLDTPPLTLTVLAGVTTKSTGERLRPATADSGNMVKLFNTEVTRNSPDNIAGPVSDMASSRQLVDGLQVVDVQLSTATLKSGEALGVDIVWALTRPLSELPLIELRLLDEPGRVITSQAGDPAYGHYPFSQWIVGEVVRDPRVLNLVGNIPAGTAHVVLAALDPQSRRSLGELELGSVAVTDRPRNFAWPNPQHTIEATFGQQIRLLGYSLDTDSLATGESLGLTLYWQAVATPAQNYTVFTHLLDQNGLIVGQKDSPPAAGTYPSSGWVPGEIVEDKYNILLPEQPPGHELALEVGLYDPVSGQRLQRDGTAEDRVILGPVGIRQ